MSSNIPFTEEALARQRAEADRELAALAAEAESLSPTIAFVSLGCAYLGVTRLADVADFPGGAEAKARLVGYSIETLGRGVDLLREQHAKGLR